MKGAKQSLKQKINELSVSNFHKDCYLALIKVPAGKITTYQDLAKSIDSKAYQAVGTAMAKNPLAPEVPCHRVIKTNGRIGNYAYGVNKKCTILKNEGIKIEDKQIKDYQNYLYSFHQS